MRCSDKSMSGLGKEERSSSSIDGDMSKYTTSRGGFGGKRKVCRPCFPTVFLVVLNLFLMHSIEDGGGRSLGRIHVKMRRGCLFMS